MVRLITAALLCVAFLSQSFAQQPTDRLTVTQWVQPKNPGRFEARVIAVDVGGEAAVKDAVVTLLGQNGGFYQGVTNSRGRVTIKGVNPGVYAMTARATGLFACYAMHVLAAEQNGSDLYPRSAEISCALVGYPTFESTVLPYLPTAYARAPLSIANANLAEVLGHVRGNEMFRVVRKGGGLVGYLYASTDRGREPDDDDQDNRLDPAEAMNVFLFKDRAKLGRDITDQRGRFDFADLAPGIYSIVVVGPDGLGAVGFELVEAAPANVRLETKEGFQFVNNAVENGAPDDEFALQCIPITTEELVEIVGGEIPPEGLPDGIPLGYPIAGGGMGPGSGMGSGGGGPGGGGGVAAAALAAAAVAAGASSSGGGGFVVSQIASPFTP